MGDTTFSVCFYSFLLGLQYSFLEYYQLQTMSAKCHKRMQLDNNLFGNPEELHTNRFQSLYVDQRVTTLVISQDGKQLLQLGYFISHIK